MRVKLWAWHSHLATSSGSTAFATAFGPLNPGLPDLSAGDATFAALAVNVIFGSASTANLISVMEDWVANWKTFYSGNGVPGFSSPHPDQIDLAARGAAWGEAVGFALANDVGPLRAQATNFLMDAAQGIASYSELLVGQPAHHPFQEGLLT